jgi:hypothetical protein
LLAWAWAGSLGDHRRKGSEKCPKQEKRLLPAAVTLRAGSSARGEQGKQPVQPGPQALTIGAEVEGQVGVGAPAAEGDPVQGSLHGVPAAGRAGAR